jgi:hypothetical protein
MIWGPGAAVGILIYLLIVLADLTLVAFSYVIGRRLRWLCPLALGINTVPVVFFAIGLHSTLRALRTNADAGLALIAGSAIAVPFLACFVASAILLYLRLKQPTPQDK